MQNVWRKPGQKMYTELLVENSGLNIKFRPGRDSISIKALKALIPLTL